MGYELRMAHRFKVPVIAILPENQDEFPREIHAQCENLLNWNSPEICNKLKEMAADKKRLSDMMPG